MHFNGDPARIAELSERFNQDPNNDELMAELFGNIVYPLITRNPVSEEDFAEVMKQVDTLIAIFPTGSTRHTQLNAKRQMFIELLRMHSGDRPAE
jgi:predicted transcriptional regulator